MLSSSSSSSPSSSFLHSSEVKVPLSTHIAVMEAAHLDYKKERVQKTPDKFETPSQKVERILSKSVLSKNIFSKRVSSKIVLSKEYVPKNTLVV